MPLDALATTGLALSIAAASREAGRFATEAPTPAADDQQKRRARQTRGGA
jgi:hypothetical protein